MQERSERLGGDIEGAGEDWERRKKDESVPGATGEPADATARTATRTATAAEELDFGRDIDDAVVAEDGRPRTTTTPPTTGLPATPTGKG